MNIRFRRIAAGLVDAFLIAAIDVAILLIVGHDRIAEMFHQGLNMRTELFSLHVAGGPYFLLLDWFLICFFDGVVVFVQPLALFALIGFSTLRLSGQDQLWFMTFLSLAVNAFYRVGMEASPLNASLGMRLFRLRVPYGQWTWRRNPLVRHFAKIVTMPIILMANFIGMPIAYLFFPSDESDPGFYIRVVAGDTGELLLHDAIAQVEFLEDKP